MEYGKVSLEKHKQWKGKLEIKSKVQLVNKTDLSLAYTPGVATPCLEIQKDPKKSYDLTMRGNLCAVITDGSAVLGLGNIGPEAGMPVMEGKCALFKTFANIDAIPLCIKSNDVDTIVNTIYMISGSFGGINLEDISAPRCFEIESRLKEMCDIPIFHDDQHGTAIVTLAGLINALKVVNKSPEECRIVTSGSGAAGIAIVKLLLKYGFKNIVMTDTKGAIYKGRDNLNWAKKEMAEVTNLNCEKGSLKDVIKGADIFLGTSAPHIVTKDMIQSMGEKSIVYACANPVPEIEPEDAKEAGAYVIATGRSDIPNQVNNLLAFPGIFRGTFDANAKEINTEMCIAAAKAIASLVKEEDLSPDYIIPSPFDPEIANIVAKAVVESAKISGAVKK